MDLINLSVGSAGGIAVYDSFLHRVVTIREFLSDDKGEFIYYKF